MGRWKGVKQLYILTFKTHHTAAILLKFSVQHVDGSVIRRIVVARIVDHHIVAIVVQHEGTLLVTGQYPLLQIAALDSRGDVYLASGESTQHYAGNAKVDRSTNMAIGELIRAATIEDDKILVRFPQLTVQLLARDDLYIVVRHLALNRNSAITAMHPKSGHFSSPKSLSTHSRATWIAATASSSSDTNTVLFPLHHKTRFIWSHTTTIYYLSPKTHAHAQ